MARLLSVETPIEQTKFDASELTYFLCRAAEKSWLIKNYRNFYGKRPLTLEDRIVIRDKKESDIFKREVAISDSDKILRRYGYGLGVLVLGKYVELPQGKAPEEELLHVSGQLRGRGAFNNDSLNLTTKDGLVRINYASMVLTEGCDIPSSHSNVVLELPTEFQIPMEDRLRQVGIPRDLIAQL